MASGKMVSGSGFQVFDVGDVDIRFWSLTGEIEGDDMRAEKNELSIDQTLTLEQFQETVLQEQLTPLWMAATGQFREPRTHVEPYLWRWKGLRERMMQALELIPLGGEGREGRVRLYATPGLSLPRRG